MVGVLPGSLSRSVRADECGPRLPRRTALVALVALVALAASLSCRATRETSPAAPADGRIFRYDVEVSDDGDELRIAARFPFLEDGALGIDGGTTRFVRDIEFWDGAAWRAVETGPEGWELSITDLPDVVRVRYRFALTEALRSVRDRRRARFVVGARLVAPALWIVLPPPRHRRDREVHLRVRTPAGTSFAAGFARTGDGSYAMPAGMVASAPVTVFGTLGRRRLDVAGSEIEVVWPGDGPGIRADDVVAWIDESGRAIGRYFDGFPSPRLLVFAYPRRRGLPGYARAFGFGGAFIDVPVSRGARPDLRTDWVMAHEMVHLGLPNLGRRHRWLEEGSATYVESVARVRSGSVGVEEFWSELARRLPVGQPRRGDVGIAGTRAWHRVYWGGALFCFVADVEIRRRTHNQKGLEHALRAVVDAGGTIAVAWPIERALAVADRAVGEPVLQPLYDSWRDRPVTVDLDDVWRKLGVRPGAGRVTLDDAAPWASIRRAIAGSAAGD